MCLISFNGQKNLVHQVFREADLDCPFVNILWKSMAERFTVRVGKGKDVKLVSLSGRTVTVASLFYIETEKSLCYDGRRKEYVHVCRVKI